MEKEKKMQFFFLGMGGIDIKLYVMFFFIKF